MEKFKVTVTYGDQSKKIPLVVTPGRELSGFQREEAHKHLKRTVRSVFSLPPGAEPAFYDRSSGSRMTPRSFTTQSEVFPRRWTLVVESVAEEGANNTFEDNSPPSTVKVAPTATSGQSNGVALAGSGPLTNGRGSPPTEGRSLGHLFMVDSGKEVRLVRGSEGFGCVLRYFTIQEDHSLEDNRGGGGSDDSSLDIMTTVFVHRVLPDGVAEQVGVREGDKVFSIGGERITSASHEGVVALLKMQVEELVMVLCPKSDDVLQLSGFAAIGYGEPGEYDTKYGHAQVYEIDLDADSGDEEMAVEHTRQGSGSSFHSNDSSHRITPDNGSKSGAAVSDSLERGGRESSRSGSGHLINSAGSSHEDIVHPALDNTSAAHEDVFIHAKLADLPVSPQGPRMHVRHPSPWAVGGDVHSMMLEHRSLAELTSVHQRNSSELSTESMELPDASFQHLRQISDVSVDSLGEDPTRKLSLEGRLFSETELARISSNTTLPSAMSSRLWSESNVTGPEEIPFPLSPIDDQQQDSSQELSCRSPLEQRRPSLRKPSLEDLTQILEEGNSEALSPVSQLASSQKDSQVSGSTLWPSQNSRSSLGTEGVKKRATRSYSAQQRRGHRPSMVAAMEQSIINEIAQHQAKSAPAQTRSRGSSSLSAMEEEESSPVADKSKPKRALTVGIPHSGVPRTQMTMSPVHSVSLEHVDEVGKEEEGREEEVMENRQMRSQPEASMMRVPSRPRPHSAGPEKMTLRSALYHGPLNRKVEKDDAGKRAHARSWRSCYAVAKEDKLYFYKDRAEAEQDGAGLGRPLDVAGALVGIPEDYNKRPNVFRIILRSGVEMLLIADTSRSVQRWIETLRKVSGLEMDMTSLVLSGYHGDTEPQGNDAGDRSKRSGQGKDDTKKLFSKFKKLMTGNTSDTATFGVPLEACPLSETHPFVPKVMDLCITEIEQRGLQCEGLYRMQGNETVISTLISEMNKGNFDASSVTDEWQDIKMVTTLLKRFLKQLPDSLIVRRMYHDFITAARAPTDEGRVQRIKELLGQLPLAHFHTLHRFTVHLATIEKHSDHNKMTASNLAIVFGPTLLNSPDEEAIVKDMDASHKLIKTLVQRHEELFDQPPPQARVRRASDEPALTQPDGTVQQSKPANLPGRKSSSLSAATGLGVRSKASRTQLTRDWIQKSDFQGSQEDSENEDTANVHVQRRNVGSMWARPQPQQHVKRRISQQLRHLNAGEDSLQLPPDSPSTTPPEVRAKARTLDGRRSSLVRKQSYAVAVARDTDSMSSLQTPMARTRSLSTEAAPTDKDVLKDFLGGSVKEPSHRIVYNFVANESETVRATSGSSSHNSPLTTYQESFL